MGKSKSKKKLSNKKAAIWSLIILAIIVSIMVFKSYDSKSEYPDQKEQQTELVRNCKEWKSKYSSIQQIGPNGFTIGKGAWVLDVNEEEWKKINFTTYVWWVANQPETIQAKTPDGSIMAGPGNVDFKNVYNSLKFKGKGCILFTTKQGIQEYWRNATPVNNDKK